MVSNGKRSKQLSLEKEEIERRHSYSDSSSAKASGDTEKDPTMSELIYGSPENESDSDSDLGSPDDYKMQPVLSTPKSSSKRPHDVEDWSETPAKDRRKQKAGELTKSPSGCIIRLWSEEDELTLLNEIIAFKHSTDRDPSANIAAFYNSTKGKFKVAFSREQLKSKIIRLKKKFVNALKKTKEDPFFSHPHEGNAFMLSKKIWGKSSELSQNVHKNDVKKKEMDNGASFKIMNKSTEQEGKGIMFKNQHEREVYELSENVWGSEKENGVKKDNGSWVDAKNGKDEAPKAWKKVQIEEMEASLWHSEVKTQQAELLLQSMKVALW